ncbi:MAG: glycoside hydrolase, partial [Cyclobacteriaceae bacterium]|nr:glycoside hydrolase [Cyclobacteriaceae bacterium]
MRISGLLVISIFITQSVLGQIPGIRLEKVGTVNLPVAGVSVVVNPKDGGNIVAALADDIYVSSDSGRAWSKIKITSPYGVNGHPQLLADKKGDLYYIHLSGSFNNGVPDISSSDRIVIQKSKDEGISWEEEDIVGFNDSTKISYVRTVWDSKNKNITAIWTKLESYPPVLVSDQSNIQVSWSSGGGKNWEDPVVVNKEPGDCQDGNN